MSERDFPTGETTLFGVGRNACSGAAALAGVSGRPDHRLRRPCGGADLPVVELVHGPARRNGGRATLWQDRAHGRARLHFKWPYGIETVRLVPTARVLKEEFGFRSLATTPASARNIRAIRPRAIRPIRRVPHADGGPQRHRRAVDPPVPHRRPIRYLFQVRDTPKTIRDITEAVMRRVVGNRLGSDVLTVGRVAVSTTAEEIQRILSAYETGVRLVTVELQDVTPGSREAGLQRGERVASGQRTDDQSGPGAGQPGIPKAGGEAARSIREAQGYAIERVNRARGEATRFQAILAEYQQAPEVTRPAPSGALGRFMAEMKGLYIVDSDQKAMVPWLALDLARGRGSQADCRREVAVKTALQVSIIVVVVAILLVLSGTFYTVEEGQQAVIVQFGRPVGETVTEAGLRQAPLRARGAPLREASAHLGWRPEPDPHQRAGVHLGGHHGALAHRRCQEVSGERGQ